MIFVKTTVVVNKIILGVGMCDFEIRAPGLQIEKHTVGDGALVWAKNFRIVNIL